jgi:hypothetical protein
MVKAAIIGAGVTGLMALSAITATTASSALPEFLPASGKATGTSGPSTLEVKGGNTFECGGDKYTGEITGPKTVSVTIEIKNCKIFGIIGTHSLGDPEGVILLHDTGTLCYLNKAKKEVGVVGAATGKTHLEGAGELAIREGDLIGRIEQVNKKMSVGKIIFEQHGGEQSVLRCEGGAEEHLSFSENEGAFKAAGFQATETISSKEEVEVMA